MLFTYLSSFQIRIYDNMGKFELFFWFLNIGYGFYELFSIIDEGASMYFGDQSNYFDFLISVIFVVALVLRIMGNISGCSDKLAECEAKSMSTTFVILWGTNAVALWIRLIFFTILSHSMGTMVRMISRMMVDIMVFLQIMGIIFVGFVISIMFCLGSTSAYGSMYITFLTMFRAIMVKCFYFLSV